MDFPGPGFDNVSLTLRRGQNGLGLFGLMRAGRSEFAQALFGRRRPTAARSG